MDFNKAFGSEVVTEQPTDGSLLHTEYSLVGCCLREREGRGMYYWDKRDEGGGGGGGIVLVQTGMREMEGGDCITGMREIGGGGGGRYFITANRDERDWGGRGGGVLY